MKFGRIFSMIAEGRTAAPDGSPVQHLIQSPLTCRLRISNSGTPSASLAAFQIYNLAPEVRNDLFKDDFEQFIYRQCIFSAGYAQDSAQPGEPQIPVIFKGNISRAFSFRQGPDWITQIECLDGGYAIENGVVALTKPAPYALDEVARDVIGVMPHAQVGTIGNLDLDRPLPFRGITLCGNAWDLITRVLMPLGGQAFIDQEKVNIVQQFEYIASAGSLDEISDETGLLDTPRRQDAMIRCRLLFEPRYEIMQKVTVKSIVPGNNGDYKIMRIDHMGTISGAVCESLNTEVTAFGPSSELEGI